MTLRAFAERVLFGDTLEDKLALPLSRDDDPRGSPVAVPARPWRPPGLALGAPRPRTRPPHPRELAAASGRGRVLHAFANHELLALELMALALLRYPEAPRGWRRSLVAAMVDEQRHLGQYLDRMAACGVALGAEPVSSFFWDCLADSPDPRAFAAGLALTFEQANLDFSRSWGAAFAAAGDAETAAVLDVVYVDEIRHVRAGVAWFRRWSEPDADLFAAHQAALRFPLTPARAKGTDAFDAAGRRAAGFDEAYVERLRVWSHSRGRTPRVLVFDPGVEQDLAGEPDAKAARALARDLALLPLVLAGADDVVLAPPPATAHLRRLADAGFALPELVPGPEHLAGRALRRLEPWGWSPRIARQLAPLADQATDPRGWSEAFRELFSKAWAAERLAELLPLAGPIGSPPAVVGRRVTDPEADIPSGSIVKAPFSTAGRDRLRVEGPLDPAARAWLARIIAGQGCVVVEPWLAKRLDLSAQLEITADGAELLGLTRFASDGRGQYRGHVVGRWTAGMSAPTARFAHATDLAGALGRVARALGPAIAATGYRGPVGVDALVHDTPEGPRLKPIVEVNPRVTMGRVALALADRVAPGAFGWFTLARKVPPAVFDAWPPVLAGGRVAEGLVPITEPGGRVTALLAVARDPAALAARTPDDWLGLSWLTRGEFDSGT